MPIFTNIVPLTEEAAVATRQAGAAFTRAIAKGLDLLLIYESPARSDGDASGRVRDAADAFEAAAERYRHLLQHATPDRLAAFDEPEQRGMRAALDVREALGGVLLREGVPGEAAHRVPGRPIPVRDLVDATRRMLEEAARRLREMRSPDAREPAPGRRIAVDLAVMQVVGVAATRAMHPPAER
ncbi:hypothetical protein [Crenalkalicoccus roseus]|uniref:hypothetical protein n=1 Tax=Crenalkalicoccus roseus TaxID=1485588 RepID=UPI0010814EC9|nr:hypothetical protein [Crenalkalicoccus roseus]